MSKETVLPRPPNILDGCCQSSVNVLIDFFFEYTRWPYSGCKGNLDFSEQLTI